MTDYSSDDILSQAQKDMGGGKYLSLRNKGEKVLIRIASKALYKNKHWMVGVDGKNIPVTCTGKSCVYCGDEVPPKDKIKKTPIFGWIVLDRNDSNAPKIFKGSYQIARDLDALDRDSQWGDPRGYDITITRTEEPGSGYYKVVPTKNSDPITEEEKKAIEEAGIDLVTELEGGQKPDKTGQYGNKGAEELETGDKSAEPVETSEGTEEDIPF